MKKRINCSMCGRFFESNGFSTLCTECFKQDMETFDKIREYLYENPRAHMFEVATNLSISISTIKRYLREGRLEIVEENNLFLKCKICGSSIRAGHYCESCSAKANHDYKSFYTGRANKNADSRLNYLTSNKT